MELHMEYDIGRNNDVVIDGFFNNKPIIIDAKPPEVDPTHWNALRRIYASWLEKLFDEGVADFLSAVEHINVFTLNSLLFRGENAVKLESIHYPADLALFGHVGPAQTAFSINELEPVVGQGQKLQFTTEPARTDLSWQVKNLPGEEVPVGTIDARGLYTAPTSTQLGGNFVRAVVTASGGGHTHSALVTVMRRAITVNPMIQVATAGDSLALNVSAGAVDGGPLDWSIEEPTSGAVVRPNPNEGGDHHYVPGPKQTGTTFSVDKLIVKNPRTNVSDFAQVLVIHGAVNLTMFVDSKATLPDNKIQLVVEGDEAPWDPKALTWSVLLGGTSATIDGTTGILTVNPSGVDNFVVVTTYFKIPNVPAFNGFIMLPLPMFSVPETIRLFSADGQ